MTVIRRGGEYTCKCFSKSCDAFIMKYSSWGSVYNVSY